MPLGKLHKEFIPVLETEGSVIRLQICPWSSLLASPRGRHKGRVHSRTGARYRTGLSKDYAFGLLKFVALRIEKESASSKNHIKDFNTIKVNLNVCVCVRQRALLCVCYSACSRKESQKRNQNRNYNRNQDRNQDRKNKKIKFLLHLNRNNSLN